ncbi:MAG: A/G-specific adenine glycosylase [Zetaproteobacteria bacterium CG2_30_46_52]|nr:MAG: A/G-specific adenine glycosylase [Zetaproteobacteria bacterium CG2_30_46_52]
MSTTDLLLSWYASHFRDLPWRRTTDPYRVWVSEIMLQQTQVTTVLPRYAAWFETFPTIQSLANAHLDDVLKLWEGLGYYRRARFIHAAAQVICEKHNGIFPQQFDDILALPGIGRSTAGAISSFCFGTSTPVLDGNVKRVLQAWVNKKANDPELWLMANDWIHQSKQPDIWNQAMMELGATVCQAKSRTCEICPMVSICQAAFMPIELVSKASKVVDVFWQVHVHQNEQQHIWLTQRPNQGIWAGLWTPPITELKKKPKLAPNLIHPLTHRRIHLYLDESNAQPQGDGRWVTSWEGFAIPTGIYRLFETRK